MMTDKEQIRRALLGDKEAQQECTDRGIVLQCPFCGMTPRFMAWYGTCSISCSNYQCAVAVTNHCFADAKEAVKHWNARPAPPIGRCEECAAYGVFKDNQCVNTGYYRTRQDFCSDFERREEE